MIESNPMDRRSFLRRVAGTALAAGAVQTVVHAADKPAMRNCATTTGPRIKKALKLGMVEGDMSLMDKFKLMREVGFDGVEVEYAPDLKIDELLAARDASGVCIEGLVCGMLWQKQLSSNDPAVRKDGIENAAKSLRLARQLDANSVLLIPGVVNKDTSYADAYKRSQAALRELIPVAKEQNVVMALENVWNNFLVSPVEAARFLDEIDSPFVRWHFDVGNIVFVGWPDQWIRILGKRIFKVDIKEYSRAKRDQEGLWKGFDVNLLDGDCDWPDVMKAFKEIGYTGWGAAEVPGGGRERLKDIADRMDKIFAM